MPRQDLYLQCNVNGFPVEVFTAECCAFCVNPGCSRSLAGRSKFDVRVGNWYSRLFGETPKLSQDDPRYESIAAKKFVEISPSLELNTQVSSSIMLPTTAENPSGPPPSDLKVKVVKPGAKIKLG